MSRESIASGSVKGRLVAIGADLPRENTRVRVRQAESFDTAPVSRRPVRSRGGVGRCRCTESRGGIEHETESIVEAEQGRRLRGRHRCKLTGFAARSRPTSEQEANVKKPRATAPGAFLLDDAEESAYDFLPAL